MAKLTSKTVSTRIKGGPGRFADGNGLYLVVPKAGRAYWMLRFTSNGKRKEMTLAQVDDLSLADARVEAALKKKQLREGLDPLIAKKQAEYASIHTVDELFADWHEGNVRRLKHHQIPQRVYMQNIAPVIGEMQPSDVTGRDIKQILQNIVESVHFPITDTVLN